LETRKLARHRKPQAKPPIRSESAAKRESSELRIIGGSMRGRKLLYSGHQRTRPMKDRVREAVFNLLGPGVVDKHAIDLFAGSGALGFEALSRGAARATFIEQHFPTADLIRQNAARLDVADRCEVLPANAFIWARKHTATDEMPWVVFCSPPFAFYIDRQAEILALIAGLLDRSPPESTLVIESDKGFDMGLLIEPESWDIREYPPAVVALYRKTARRSPPAN
jgi:16S rRNA (guanine966-N2)-methyltransferase